MTRTVRNWIFLAIVIGLVLLIDQVSKTWIIQNLMLYESRQPIPALYPFFQLTRSFNTGAAFGFLPHASDIFLIVAVAVVIGMLYFYPRLPTDAHIGRLAIGLICGGALGNAIDRLRYDHVIDFIHYQIPGLLSNVSNLADHAIVLGVILMLLDTWRIERREKQAIPTHQDEISI
ncbi:MAG: signal peptidase II [Anaerolineae bacterium]|jgi:signal peptidase II|nr:signal peptidase II [Anaerolineae bacterium]